MSNIIILLYHGFTDEREDPVFTHGKHLQVRKFEEQIAHLRTHYNIITLDDAAAFYASGKALPPRPVVITMDDGYRSNFTLAYSVLKKYDAPAAIFVSTDFIDGKNALWVDRLEYAGDPARYENTKALLKRMPYDQREMMLARIEQAAGKSLAITNAPSMYAALAWDEVIQMQKSGLVSIGSHTCSHMIATNCFDEDLAMELSVSKKRVEDKTGQACRYFAYPNGQKEDFDERTKNAVIKAGFKSALTTMVGTNDKRGDLYALKRLNIHNSGDLAGFKRTLSSFARFLRFIKNAYLSRA